MMMVTVTQGNGEDHLFPIDGEMKVEDFVAEVRRALGSSPIRRVYFWENGTAYSEGVAADPDDAEIWKDYHLKKEPR